MAKDPIMEELCERFETAQKVYEELRTRYVTAREACDTANSVLEGYALPLVRKALAEGDEHRARSAAHALPFGTVARLRAMEAFRQVSVPWEASVDVACVRAYAHDCACPKCLVKPPQNERGWQP